MSYRYSRSYLLIVGLLACQFFESMSGLTTTGSTVIANLEVVPSSILLWRSLTHWIGGIGIIVLFVALLPQIAGSAVYLFNAEVSGFSNNTRRRSKNYNNTST